MEVHAHTHTARKKWTHYFWEFLMLFLAVFAGFLAENQREHIIEHRREKNYIISLARDLEKDTADLHLLILLNKGQKKKYDSLLNLLKQADSFKEINLLYYYYVPTTSYFHFTATEGTIRQLENAGGLRLIRNQPAVDIIMAYYGTVKKMEGQANTFFPYFNKYHEIAFTVFDLSQIDTLFFTRQYIQTGNRSLALLTKDKVIMKVLYNNLYSLWLIVGNYIQFLEEAEQMATEALDLLKKNYHLNK